MKKLLLFIILLASFPNIGKSQLSIDSVATYQALAPQDTVVEGTVLNFNVKVLYGSAVPFTGTIYLISGVDSSAGVLSVDTVGSLSVVNLINDSAIITLYDTADSPNGYRKGGDIIVIWPIATGLTPVDTFRADIWVLPMATANEEFPNKSILNQFSIYPNPVSEELYIENLSDKYIDNIKIMDLNGRIIYNQVKHKKIDVSHLIKGSYLLEIELEDKQKLIYRIIKAN